MSIRDKFAMVFITITFVLLVGSYWVSELFFIWIAFSVVISLVMFLVNDYKQSKRIRELEDKFAKSEDAVSSEVSEQ